MKEQSVLLNMNQRKKVHQVCLRHAKIRGWVLHAINVRSNHVHLVVTADADPKKVRDQFKANATRVLRQPPDAIVHEKIWTRGGDTEIIDGDESLEQVVLYVTETQDQKDKEK